MTYKMFESDIEKHGALSRGGWKCQNSATAWFSRAYHSGPKIFPRGVYLSRRPDNRRRKEFFTPLFLTPGAFCWRKSAERRARRVWPRAGHGWVILISGLHAPLGRLDDYFGSGAGQYLDNTLTGAAVSFDRLLPSPHCRSLYPLPFPRSPAEYQRMLSKADFSRYPLPTLIGHVTNVRANRISQIGLWSLYASSVGKEKEGLLFS